MMPHGFKDVEGALEDPQVKSELTPPWLTPVSTDPQNPDWPPAKTPPPSRTTPTSPPLPPPPKYPKMPPAQPPSPPAKQSGAAGLSNFAEVYVPVMWVPLIQMFGTTVQYTPVGGSQIQIVGMWKEGAEGEPISPGRYSVFEIEDADIPNGPVPGDILFEASRGTFMVARVDASAYGYSRLTLKEQ